MNLLLLKELSLFGKLKPGPEFLVVVRCCRESKAVPSFRFFRN